MPVLTTNLLCLWDILKKYLKVLKRGRTGNSIIRKLFAMGVLNLRGFANLLEAKINFVASSASQSGRAEISPQTLRKMEEHHKYICAVLPLLRLLEFFQQINHCQYRDIRTICGWDFEVGFYIKPFPKNNRRLSDNTSRAAQASAMRRKLEALREKVKTLPQWLKLLNGFEEVKRDTEVQNFLQELEKVVGRKFPKFLHHLSEFIHCSSSIEMTNTVRGAIRELCGHFAQAQLEQ